MKFDSLKEELEKDYEVSVEHEELTGLDRLGLPATNDSSHINTIISYCCSSSNILAALNVACAMGATACTIAANMASKANGPEELCQRDNITVEAVCDTVKSAEDAIMCTTNLCVASYVLGTAAVGFSTLEQHIKKANLDRWEKTLQDGNVFMCTKINEEKQRAKLTNSITTIDTSKLLTDTPPSTTPGSSRKRRP